MFRNALRNWINAPLRRELARFETFHATQLNKARSHVNALTARNAAAWLIRDAQSDVTFHAAQLNRARRELASLA